MLAVKGKENAAAVEASFAVWGGNNHMRACDVFFIAMLERISMKASQHQADEELKSQNRTHWRTIEKYQGC